MGQNSLHLKTFLTINTQEGELQIFPENILIIKAYLAFYYELWINILGELFT
jgi:hypothetical protein